MLFFVFGFIGGLFRGAMGLVKYMQSYKDVEIRPYYFSATVLVSGLIGFASAWVTHDMGLAFLGIEEIPLSLALVIGYAGGDFLENVYKIVSKKEDLFSVGGKVE